jgi:hypothetical protein
MKIYITFTFIVEFVLFTTTALAMALDLDNKAPLPGETSSGPTAFNQISPVISGGGNGHLTAWIVYRTNGSYFVSEQSRADIFAARLDASGNLIDTVPIPLSMMPGDESSPVIAWNDANWLVAWLAQTSTPYYWSTSVLALRVSPGGQVLDPGPISVYKYPWSSRGELALTSDGNNWLAVTHGDSAGENDLRGVRIAPDGTVLDPGGVVLVEGMYSLAFYLDLAYAPDAYLLTYRYLGHVFGLRLGPDLQPLDPSPFQITDTYLSLESPRVSANGSNFFVAWREYNN